MTILDLWLPILVAAVFVFIASSVLHMCLPIHRSDYQRMPDEEAVLAAMREHGVGPGAYMFPCAAGMKEAATPEHVAKMEKGPVGVMQVMPSGQINMGKLLGQWFVFCIVISVFVAYIASFSLQPGEDYMRVFRLTGVVAILGYGATNITDSIWKGQSWWVTTKFLFDGVVYGLVTAGAFGWLWPAAY